MKKLCLYIFIPGCACFWNVLQSAFMIVINSISTLILGFQDENWLSWVFEKVVLVMVCYFVISIVNSMAQSYAKRLQQQRHSEEKTK